jgi:sarcosine oxidase, subunit gamma
VLEHRTPFDAGGEGLCHIDMTFERAGLRVSAIRERGLLLLQTASRAALQGALAEALDLTLPPAQHASLRGEYALLFLTPAEWLLECPAEESEPIQIDLSQRVGSSLAVVTDLSDALASFEVSGAHAPEILMTGCSLDLTPRAFPCGRVARTALADVPAILWNPGNPDRVRCLIDRGFAKHFLLWLEGTMPQGGSFPTTAKDPPGTLL